MGWIFHVQTQTGIANSDTAKTGRPLKIKRAIGGRTAKFQSEKLKVKILKTLYANCKNLKSLLDDLILGTLIDDMEPYSRDRTCVITYGTFDVFHFGHSEILRRAKNLGDYLIVGVSTDEFNKEKGKKCVQSFEHRKKVVESIKFVDMVIPEKNWEQKQEDIDKYHAKILVMGDDWTGKFDYLKNCKTKYLPRTPGVSSTEIKIKCCEE